MEKLECNDTTSYDEANQNELQIELRTLYSKSNYPSKEEMNLIAQKHETTYSKVTNWFKQKRRRDFYRGKLNKKNYQKNWFSNEQTAFLQSIFLRNKNPNSFQYTQLATILNSTQKHVKNWFSHQRQKLYRKPQQDEEKILPYEKIYQSQCFLNQIYKHWQQQAMEKFLLYQQHLLPIYQQLMTLKIYQNQQQMNPIASNLAEGNYSAIKKEFIEENSKANDIPIIKSELI